MRSWDSYWVVMPEGTRAGQISVGEFVRVGETLMRVEGSSTTMLLVRRPRWWERLWRRMVS